MISSKSKSLKNSFWLSLLILWLFFFITIQLGSFNNLPRGVHQWAQADRYAIAARYLEDRPFLKPATYSLTSDDGEVGVEFPLIQFVSAQIAKVAGSNYLPFIYRSLSFLLLLTGLLLLARQIASGSPGLSLLCVILVICSPVMLNYGNGFLPDAAALGLVLMALSQIQKESIAFWYGMLILLFLAALVKTSSGVYLLAILAWWFLLILLKKEKKYFLPLLTGVLFCGLIAWYDYQYIYLRNQKLWSTLFLSQAHKITTFQELIGVLKAFVRYGLQYLNAVQYLLFIPGFLLAYRFIKSKREYQMLAMLLIAGLLGFIYLFGIQFMNHDYYVLASIMPLAVLLQLLGIKWLAEHLNGWKFNVSMAVLVLLSFSLGSSLYFKRMGNSVHIAGQEYGYNFEWMRSLKKEINSLTHALDTVFVVYEMEPNLSLVYLDKRGIVFNREEMSRDTSNFYYWLERRQPNYLVCRNQNLAELKNRHAKFIKSCFAAFENKDYTIYKIDYGY